ncbi:Kinesin, motor region domain-containing protein [Rozella allomycis CSF55]|uniref:Kinesin-like protein n=1 Tax=Rozella allomycis (strain CSF55) TaxID=988480 RepID=A0A075AUN8_ROZAC|nr:Kinesin, motor region domain-containing protein [Rozella allomycis CSF55]|eukprot:EPZ33973.1 Kinesin, motor region domain-containing protein [Rozella allomycis CSF55]
MNNEQSINFNVPAKFLKASQARMQKMKQNSLERDKSMVPPKLEPLPKAQEGPKGPNIKPVTAPSKTALEIDRIRKKRELRRQQQQEIKDMNKLIDPETKDIKKYKSIIAAFVAGIPAGVSNSKKSLSEISQEAAIRVCVRKRPINEKESSLSNFDVVTCRSNASRNALMYVHEPKVKFDMSKDMEHHQFCFDNVFDETSTNEAVYSSTLKTILPQLLNQGRISFFAYGQTSSGKTHTVFGNQSNPGVYHYACKDIFKLIKNDKSLFVTVCFYEIYGGRIYDLFQNKARLQLLEDGKGDIKIMGLQEIQVGSYEDMIRLIDYGFSTRTTASTSANDESSRSHAILQISIRQGDGSIVKGKFSLIDLAGSERASDVNHTDRQRRIEGAEINKSLLALKECIRALNKRQSGAHIPFRASKLTQVLRDCFIGNNSLTVMIAAVSPASDSCDHTLNTLRYADRVKELKPEKNSKLKVNTKRSISCSNMLPSPLISPEDEDIEKLHESLNTPFELLNLHKTANAIVYEHENLTRKHDEALKEQTLISQTEKELLDEVDIDIYVDGLEKCINDKMEILGDLLRNVHQLRQDLSHVDTNPDINLED